MIEHLSKSKTEQKGFTMIELLVVVFVFTIMATITSGIFIRAMLIERKSFAAQNIEENALAVFETMAKEIRVSTIANQDNNCSGAPLSTLSMTFNDSAGGSGTLAYSLNGSGIIERTYGGVTYQISSSDITFNSLGFCVLGSSTSPYGNDATRVTIIASISSKGQDPITVRTQTTITSRDVSGESQN